MPAVACLRVLLDDNRTEVPAEALGPLVAKYSNVFLEVRWRFPREADQLSHYSYLLADPGADHLDTAELAHLSQELQERLFGVGTEEAVKLVLFEGDPDAIQAFAALSAEQVAAAMKDPSGLPGGGRLRRIAADGGLVDVPEPGSEDQSVDDERLGPSIDGCQGIYFALRGAFVGDVVCSTPVRAPTYYSLVDGEDHRPEDSEAFDAACVFTALQYLADFQVVAPLYLPVDFSSLVRPSQRADYLTLLGVLPKESRRQLAATIYDVPRALSFQALKTTRAALDPFVSNIDLRVSDPDFEIDRMAPESVGSVTLVLPDASQELRFAALRRFTSRMPDYRRRRIWPGVTNLRFRAERELAISLGVPFLTGPGICRIQSQPVGGRVWPADRLPLLSIHTQTLEVAGA